LERTETDNILTGSNIACLPHGSVGQIVVLKDLFTLKLQKVTLFGIRVLADVIKNVKMRSSWIRVGPELNGMCPYKNQKRHTHLYISL
jgi:hypothetical protein